MISLLEILNELEINKPINLRKLLYELLKSDSDGNSLFEEFDLYYSYDDWFSENGDEDDPEDEKALLAKKFFDLIYPKIYTEEIKDSNDLTETKLDKSYKYIITYGLGYNNTKVILHNFN